MKLLKSPLNQDFFKTQSAFDNTDMHPLYWTAVKGIFIILLNLTKHIVKFAKLCYNTYATTFNNCQKDRYLN